VRERGEGEQEKMKVKVACSAVVIGRWVVEQRVSSRAGGCRGGDGYGYGYGSRLDAQQAVGASAGLCVGDLSRPEIRGLHRGSRSAADYLFPLPLHVHEPLLDVDGKHSSRSPRPSADMPATADAHCRALPRSATTRLRLSQRVSRGADSQSHPLSPRPIGCRRAKQRRSLHGRCCVSMLSTCDNRLSA
jgi:hypothetical protein